MKPANPEVVESLDKSKPVSRVGQLRREKMIAGRPEESKEQDKNQAVPLNPPTKI